MKLSLGDIPIQQVEIRDLGSSRTEIKETVFQDGRVFRTAEEVRLMKHIAVRNEYSNLYFAAAMSNEKLTFSANSFLYDLKE